MRASTEGEEPQNFAEGVRGLHAALVSILPENVVLFGSFVGLATFLIVFWRICSKAGYHGSLGALMLVPGANVALLLVLAFGRWPIERELRARRKGKV